MDAGGFPAGAVGFVALFGAAGFSAAVRWLLFQSLSGFAHVSGVLESNGWTVAVLAAVGFTILPLALFTVGAFWVERHVTNRALIVLLCIGLLWGVRDIFPRPSEVAAILPVAARAPYDVLTGIMDYVVLILIVGTAGYFLLRRRRGVTVQG